MGSLDVAPSEVQPSTDAGGDEVDLFDRALPDVGDPQVVRGPKAISSSCWSWLRLVNAK
jgi:hypothetical protein